MTSSIILLIIYNWSSKTTGGWVAVLLLHIADTDTNTDITSTLTCYADCPQAMGLIDFCTVLWTPRQSGHMYPHPRDL